MASFVINYEVEALRDTKDFAMERRAEFDTHLGGVELHGRWERERKKAKGDSVSSAYQHDRTGGKFVPGTTAAAWLADILEEAVPAALKFS